jgi:hypothetical protein
MTPAATSRSETYCRQLALHCELLWRYELPILASAPAFDAARTIVDLGAGCGAFGRRLAVAYPDKRFLGVEPDAAIYAVGARSAFPTNYRYEQAGYEDVTGTYDLLFARHVVMYVPDREALYAWAREHVRAAIVANWDDSVNVLEPTLPLFFAALQHGMQSRADELATTHVGDRELAGMAAEWAAAGLVPTGSATIAADVSDPDQRRVYHHIMRLSLTAINPEALTRPLIDELYEWSVNPAAHATLGEKYHSILNPIPLAHREGALAIVS